MKPPPAQMTKDDKVVVTAMSEYPLKPGQMLLIGPEMVNILLGRALPDKPQGKLVYDKKEWNKK